MNETGNGQGINSPEFELKRSTGEPTFTRAISDAAQAVQVYTTLSTANRTRNLKNARIMAKYNAERPYRQEELEAEGLSWKSNFSSKVLSTLIDKVSPRFTRAVAAARYLTTSKLPENVPGASTKSETFQREITSLIRSWPEWRDFIASLAQENALFGYTVAGWLSEYTWKPKHFRQDQFFIPEGTKQYASSAQIICYKELLLPHELFDLVRDQKAAEDAGWDVVNVLDSINSAMPELVRSKATEVARIYEDLVRSASVGVSHTGSKVVQLGHVFAQEVTGKVTHYIVDIRSQNSLFSREDRFESMADVGSFFAFQQGNNTMHGSKGIGREIYAMAGVIERSRNEVVDRLQLAGKLIVQGDEKQLRRYRAHVVGNALLIDSSFTIQTQRIEGDVEPFMTLDAFMRQLMDEVAGNVSPKTLDQAGEGMRSPAAWNLMAAREEESKDTVIERFFNQLSGLVSAIQRRACSEQCVDEDAKAMQDRLLKAGLTREDINTLSGSVSAEVAKDLTELERQKILLFCQEKRGNPLYNQTELERRAATAVMDSNFAQAVLLPENDQTIMAEQSRQQQLEVLAIQGLQAPVPVSPRDNHEVHLQLLIPVVESMLQVLASNGGVRPVVNLLLEHATQHLMVAKQQADPNVNLTKYASAVADFKNRLTQLDAHDKAVQEAAQAGAASPAEVVNAGAGAARQAAAVAPEGSVPEVPEEPAV